MASAVAGPIASRLAGLLTDETILLWGFKDDVDELRKTMEKLQALKHDADRRESQNGGERRETVRVWMKNFKSATYDVEDLLDKLEAIKFMKQNQPKIKLLFSSYNPLFVRLTMVHKMKKLKKDLCGIEEEGHRLDLVPRDIPAWTAGGTSQDTIDSSTNGYRGTIKMIGRDTEKQHLMELLLKTDAKEDISIIPIVGLGGMGKTTLAQEVYGDKGAKIFDLRVWIHMSKKFDLRRIRDKIISEANKSTSTSEASDGYTAKIGDDLPAIMEQMQNLLPNKRYLIILDDMWEEGIDNLNNLKQMLQYGARGSKIILTARKQQVVENLKLDNLVERRKIFPVLRSGGQINLDSLSVEDCWNLMRHTALCNKDVGGLEDTGKKIAERCGGLPLLACSLGFLMSQEVSAPAWEEIRKREIILDMEENKETFQNLMLSYYYMSLEFKLCFTYCAVFPKGFLISTDQLIQQWRALGYIPESTKGRRCINYLLGMSFLQISQSSQSPPELTTFPDKLTMHDLVHDLARIILDKESIVLDASERMTWNGLEKHYCRHMRLVKYKKPLKSIKEFPSKIRSLHFTVGSGMQLRHSKSKYLRVLDFRGCSNKIEGEDASTNISLPSSIHRLLLLRYLDASGLPITSLPKSFHKLQNMQTLIMLDCALKTLPDNICCLLNLVHFDLSGNRSLKKLPMSFGELSTLSFLNLSNCSELKEVPESIHKLKSLRHLDMPGCCALQKLPDLFGSLPKLLFLNMSGCSKLVKLPDSVNLESLEHLRLSSCHELQSLPENFGNLDKLKFLNLSDCYKLQVLPESFCQLRYLKDLDLSDCHDLKELPECFGSLSELHSLNLTSCSKLQSLPESFGDLSKLKHLNLSYCVRFEKLTCSFCNLKLQTLFTSAMPNLCDLPDGIGNMTSLTLFEGVTGVPHIDFNLAHNICRRLGLQARVVHDVHDVQEKDHGWCSSIVSLGKLTCRRLQIKGLDNVKRPEDAEIANLRDNSDLRGLTLTWYDAKVTENRRDAEVLENLVPPRTLELFELEGYTSRNFPNWMVDLSSYLPYLTSISLFRLRSCDSLPPFGMLSNLRYLSMLEIPSISKIGKEFYGEEGTCKRLRVIQLRGLLNLKEWWTTRSGDEDDELLIPNLHRLVVHHCPKLAFLPYPPKSMHWYLSASNEVLPERGFGQLSSSTLPFHAQILSHDFSRSEWGRLQHLTTLEELDVGSRGGFSTFPEASPRFPSLRYLLLSLGNLEMLPEWLGQLTTLEELVINGSPNLTSLPANIRNLTTLKRLRISGCPRLVEMCMGEDAHKISHIPQVELDPRIFVPGQPVK